MKQIIKDSLDRAQSYKEYRGLVSQLVLRKSTTGNEKTESFIEFTKLNDSRMRRWDKTLSISENSKTQIKAFKDKVIWLVLTESWCGDAAHVLPVINKVAELSDNIEFKTVIRDENLDLMNLFLTHGNQAVPKLIMLDRDSKEVIGTYGPRPHLATKIVNDFNQTSTFRVSEKVRF